MPDVTGAIDFAVIGAGIAGASVAAHLAREARVLLLEMEAQPGYHTTGRSAAIFAPIYGPAPIRALTRAAEKDFRAPPDGFSEHALISPRPILMVARRDQRDALDGLMREQGSDAPLRRLDADGVREAMPLLRRGYAAAGVLDPTGQDIDVHALHQGYLKQLRAAGGHLQNRAEVRALAREPDGWRITTADATFRAQQVVNAAGAWADRLGALAGAEPIGLMPRRRTAMIVAGPDGARLEDTPLTVDIDEEFYLKPEAGRLLVSPANADPEPPGDVQPDEMDIALCIDRIERAFDLSVRRIETRWAGLRSFVADGCPVAGYSQRADGFYWLAGQGGYGIQTAPSLARFAASELLGQSAPEDVLAEGLDPPSLRPDRPGLG